MRRKITLLTISLVKGGAENQLVKLAVDLKKRGDDVTIVALLPENDFKNLISENGINYRLIPFNSLLSIGKITFFFKKTKPEVIIAFMFGACVIGRFIKLFTNIPLITSVRNNEIDKKFYYLFRLTRKLDTVTTFNSSYSINKFINEDLTVKSKSHLVNNSINIPIENDINDKSKYSDVFTITSMAHFRPQKDYRTLIEAVKILRDNNRNVHLFILGHLYNQKWPFELLHRYKLKSNIEIVGFKNSPNEFLEKSNGVVLSSFWEGTPNALLEAMANKLPVISSEIPGCKELLELSKGGLFFETGNAQSLSDKIAELMDMTNEQRTEMGENGYNHVSRNYASEIVYDKWDEIINSALLNS